MEKFIECFGEKFKVRHYFDPDVRESTADPKTGIVYERQLGDIEGVSIYSSDGELLGSFEHIDFDNDEIISKIIEQVY
ncbi:hypothetical protein CH333_02370 [candidate division WOR-3 bacterium JGI_Cruoil_03_44_89]|uniref:Uncharacterized protein n=1 Tax=candidate division WOR-3 bacterium JGI_Cruoil_03_44_89 TaxID=1973748 RepID=A0A235BX26_UNCW3|nr:MAG: hypothetical protein CH333_02370 [candidate division WOR-3 bacterium JGI_Cruoil_03_44_89]